MMEEPKPTPDEEARLRSLHALGILDTPPEERFDRITRLASRLFDVPIALITLIDEDRQWFKSRVGIDVTETPRSISFCAHAIHDRGPMVIGDTHVDHRFVDNPMVVDGPGVRFYAGQPLHNADGVALGTLCVADTQPRQFTDDDLTALGDLASMVEHELASLALGQAIQELVAAADGQPNGLAILHPVHEPGGEISDFRVTYVNPAGSAVIGKSPDEMVGECLSDYFGPDRVAAVVSDWRRALVQREFVEEDLTLGNAIDGKPTHKVLVTPLTDAVAVSIQDNTARRRLEEQVRHSSSHDSLTDLPGRQAMVAEVDHALAQIKASGGCACVVHLDVNGFKEVNDTLGHEIGDALLRLLADRLVAAAPPGGVVGRPGGDEFLLLCTENTPQEGVELVDALLAAVRRPVHLIGNELRVTASAGLATSTSALRSADALIRNAEIAMYQAKGIGPDAFQVFNEELREGLLDRVERKSVLRTGLRRNEFVPWYQPEVSMETGEIVGLEALARWQRGGGRPAETAGPFIELAEQTGLIRELGRAMLEGVCEQISAWKRALGCPVPRVWVNLSASQLVAAGTASEYLGALERHGLEPEVLGVEITETALLSDAVTGIAALDQLSRAGVRVAVDDFGTGYSSLTYVKSHHVDVLKVDGSFVAGLPDDPEDVAIVSATVALGASLGMHIVAEGVETTAQLDAARSLGCTEAQGFLFTPALSGDKVGLLLETQPWRHS